MGESENSVSKYSKEWVRENWDYEEDNARKSVVLVKLFHEWHILLPGAIVGLIPAGTFWHLEAGLIEVFGSYFAVFGGGYVLFFQMWWCSTVTGEN